MSELFKKFVGFSRWLRLRAALRESSAHEKQLLSSTRVLTALLVAATPLTIVFLDEYYETGSRLTTYSFAICSLLAILLTWASDLNLLEKRPLRQSLSLSHTAVALGCIPAVLVIALSPQLFVERQEVLQSVVPQMPASTLQERYTDIVIAILMISAWAAVTEELIFRRLLLTSVRRWRVITDARVRDILGVGLSSLLFGFAHYPTWGLAASLALSGLGVGFSLAYLATRERLLPVVLYHFAFDVLSLSIALLIR